MRIIIVPGEINIPYLKKGEYIEILEKDQDWIVKMREKYSLPIIVVKSVWKFFEFKKEKADETLKKIAKNYNPGGR